MMLRLFVLALLCFTFSSCDDAKQRKPAKDFAAPPSPSPGPNLGATSGEWGKPNINVCALLSKEQIGAMQNAPISNALSLGRPDGDFLVSQCIYTADPESSSVVVSVSELNPQVARTRSIAEFWRERLERGEKEEHEGSEREFIAPRKIGGVAEDACWMGGALYARKNQVILRVSVGGPEGEEAKIAKSKTLCTEALARLFP